MRLQSRLNNIGSKRPLLFWKFLRRILPNKIVQKPIVGTTDERGFLDVACCYCQVCCKRTSCPCDLRQKPNLEGRFFTLHKSSNELWGRTRVEARRWFLTLWGPINTTRLQQGGRLF